MLQPRKVKHRKWHKGRSRNKIANKGTKLNFGEFGLKAIEPGWLTARQIESARRAMTRHIQRGGKIWIMIFPDKPKTTKGVEVPMGGGKGDVDHFVAPVKPGRIIFEIGGLSEQLSVGAMRLASYKLPIKTKIIKR